MTIIMRIITIISAAENGKIPDALLKAGETFMKKFLVYIFSTKSGRSDDMYMSIALTGISAIINNFIVFFMISPPLLNRAKIIYIIYDIKTIAVVNINTSLHHLLYPT